MEFTILLFIFPFLLNFRLTIHIQYQNCQFRIFHLLLHKEDFQRLVFCMAKTSENAFFYSSLCKSNNAFIRRDLALPIFTIYGFLWVNRFKTGQQSLVFGFARNAFICLFGYLPLLSPS